MVDKHERVIQELGTEIVEAAAQYPNVDPGIVAGILWDESMRAGPEDALQNLYGRARIPNEGFMERLTDANLRIYGAGDPVEEISFGKAQMTPNTLRQVINAGYIEEPEGWDVSQEVGEWSSEQLDIALEILLNDKRAPELVAARVQQTIDHWNDPAKNGTDLTNRLDVLGELYSQGLANRNRGVHPNPGSDDRGDEIAAKIPELEALLSSQQSLRQGAPDLNEFAGNLRESVNLTGQTEFSLSMDTQDGPQQVNVAVNRNTGMVTGSGLNGELFEFAVSPEGEVRDPQISNPDALLQVAERFERAVESARQEDVARLPQGVEAEL